MAACGKIDFLGIKIDALTKDRFVEKILEFALFGKCKMITYLDANCVNVYFKDTEYRKILGQADIIHADGMGVVWASRFLGSPLPQRINPMDFFDEWVDITTKKGITFYLLGGKPDAIQNAVDRLKNRFLNLEIVGFHHGYFDKEEDKIIIEDINKLRPNILLVGMSVPRQEKWIHKHLDKLEVNLCFAVGGMFDILSGSFKKAPGWMREMGLEWLYRLYQEPKRLWRRYLIGNFIFIYRVLRWKVGTILKFKINRQNNK